MIAIVQTRREIKENGRKMPDETETIENMEGVKWMPESRGTRRRPSDRANSIESRLERCGYLDDWRSRARAPRGRELRLSALLGATGLSLRRHPLL